MKAYVLAALTLAVAPAFAQDPAGRNLSAGCAICHGTEGRPVSKDIAPLAGLSREHIVAQMQAFRDGKRPATVMHQIVKGYTDAQVDSIAAWYAGQKK
jgi:cytochrome c553